MFCCMFALLQSIKVKSLSTDFVMEQVADLFEARAIAKPERHVHLDDAT